MIGVFSLEKDVGCADFCTAIYSKKELLTIPGAVHTDLYDNLDVIPFDKIQKFFEENGVG